MARLRWPFRPSEAELIRYLRATSIRWLRDQSRDLVSGLNKDSPLREQRKKLLDLWPAILIDALLHLKEADPREWDPKEKRIEYSSFFDANSLGVDELGELIKGFDEFESMLYGASPQRYRDHTAHVFRVWILGQLLLREGLNSRLTADGHFERGPNAISPPERECMWAIAALCHDLGYPLAYVERINERSRKAFAQYRLSPSAELRFEFSPRMHGFNDTIIRLMASRPLMLGPGQYRTHLQNKYYLKFVKSFDNLDHGIISALLISRCLVYFLESDLSTDDSALCATDARQFLIRREVLRAIASHTCPDVYHLRFNTLPFLLCVVDELDEGQRPTWEEQRGWKPLPQDREVKIIRYSPTTIHAMIRTNQAGWPDKGDIIRRVNRLHRILRLGVGTPSLNRQLSLQFEFRNKGDETAGFRLRGGRIEKFPSDWF